MSDNSGLYIRPAYPPGVAPMAPVPARPMARGPWPDGTPASPAPALPYPQPSNEIGEAYGIQCKHTWKPGKVERFPVFDQIRAKNLWRMVLYGSPAVRVDIGFGSKATFNFLGLSLPLRCTVPGQLSVECYLTEAQDAEQMVGGTLTPATSGGLIELRRLVTGTVALDERAMQYFALTASSVNVRGTVVAVPALSSLPLLSGSTLVSGTGYEELDT